MLILGHYEQALCAYDRAIEIKPESAEAWFKKGGALFLLGHYEQAIAAYDHSLEINSEYAMVWSKKGATLLSAGTLR